VTAECPARKLSPPGVETGPALELVEGAGEPVWVVRSFDLARRILREPAATRQAGFGADQVFRARGMRPPVLYLEGEQHRLQRRAAARFFAPAVIEGYRPMMEQLADQLVARLRADRATDLSRLAMRMAVQVAARVIGLTDSSVSGMSRRLGAFFASNPLADGRSPAALRRRVLGGARTAHFYGADVKPAIRARRRHPGEDNHQPAARAGLQRPGDPDRVHHLRRGRDGHDPRADGRRRVAPDRRRRPAEALPEL
jgi:cytochrome P450